MEWINVVADLIKSVGFPVAVCGFLLWERMTTTKEMTKAVTGLTEVIARLNDKLE